MAGERKGRAPQVLWVLIPDPESEARGVQLAGYRTEESAESARIMNDELHRYRLDDPKPRRKRGKRQ